MEEWVAKIIEKTSKKEPKPVKNIVEILVESWTNWDPIPYFNVTKSEIIKEIPPYSPSIQIACDMIEIMRSKNPKNEFIEWTKCLVNVLKQTDIKHMDKAAAHGLAKSRDEIIRTVTEVKLGVRELAEEIPETPAFTKMDYLKNSLLKR